MYEYTKKFTYIRWETNKEESEYMSKYREPFVGFTYILGDNIYVSGGSEFFTESEPATILKKLL